MNNGGGHRGRNTAIGGGLAGLLGLVAMLFLGFNPFEEQQTATPAAGRQQIGERTDLQAACQTGADADQNEQCRIVGVVNSIQNYWTGAFAASSLTYRNARTQLFTGATQTSCGYATSQVGPFYCPADQKVYLDLTFFQQLQRQFGASGGPFAQAYVVGHEYGHHVQNLLGTMNKVKSGTTGASSPAVRLELQADCYAGVWMRNAVKTGYLTQVTGEDLAQALSAAEAVGDDRIQSRTQGYVQPDAFTHGTSRQRTKWVNIGYDYGDPGRCTTFSGAI
ncbi:neutral zinc metallopeptidase [Actinocorallia longicatena]|uniref:Neutral zinc metallopeptidase n=1 Tax=Actinocorallia longicatena TaxID=111803 RepID=A0ABP6QD36_9ACTN